MKGTIIKFWSDIVEVKFKKVLPSCVVNKWFTNGRSSFLNLT